MYICIYIYQQKKMRRKPVRSDTDCQDTGQARAAGQTHVLVAPLLSSPLVLPQSMLTPSCWWACTAVTRIWRHTGEEEKYIFTILFGMWYMLQSSGYLHLGGQLLCWVRAWKWYCRQWWYMILQWWRFFPFESWFIKLHKIVTSIMT